MNKTDFAKFAFRPVCNKEEIERLYNIQSAEDYLLKIRAETIVDHMRLFRVYRNKALIDEKNWSLEKSFNQEHFVRFIKNIGDKDRKRCESIIAGNIFSNDPNGRIFISEFGPIITICDSLRFFFKFMNLALMDFVHKVPDHVRVNSMRIALRVMLKTEALDFLMDPRGIVPEDIAEIMHSTIPDQMSFIAGHEYAHYLLGHISESNVAHKPIFHAIFPNEKEYKPLAVYNQSQVQEFEADVNSISMIGINDDQKLNLIEAALLWFGSLDLFETVLDVISPKNPYGVCSHPSARDRYENILTKMQLPKNIDTNKWKKFLKTIDFYKKLLADDVSSNIEGYETYGSAYLDKPNTEWRGPELRDRIDYY